MADLPAASENAAVSGIFTPGTEYYLSLHTASPGTDGSNEVVGGGYTRQPIYFGDPLDGVMTSITEQQNFSNMPSDTVVTPR